MKECLIYLAGFCTPFLLAALVFARWAWEDWREGRRYQRAWDKFGAEFDHLAEERLAGHRISWAQEPWKYERMSCDRDRYFKMRWQNGYTTEV